MGARNRHGVGLTTLGEDAIALLTPNSQLLRGLVLGVVDCCIFPALATGFIHANDPSGRTLVGHIRRVARSARDQCAENMLHSRSV